MKPVKIGKIKCMAKGQVALKLIEDEVSNENDPVISVNGVYSLKNSLNEEGTFSYFARVLMTSKNKANLKKGDVVYLNKIYERELFKNKQFGNFMITKFNSIRARIHDFDKNEVFFS